MTSPTPRSHQKNSDQQRKSKMRRRKKLQMELLEERRMLARVTVISHGFSLGGTLPTWPAAYGQAILEDARRDAAQSSNNYGSLFVHDPITGSWQANSSWWSNTNRADQEIALVFNWAQESNNAELSLFRQNGWLEAAADSLFSSLVTSNGHLPGGLEDKSILDLARSPHDSNYLDLHFIGHSRGAVLNSLVTERMAAYFPELTIDQVTSLDPHPASPMNDPGYVSTFGFGSGSLRTFSNVHFADNYYRQDGLYEADGDFDGVVAPGAFNVKLREPTLGSGGSLLGGYDLEHSDVHMWYYGTITAGLNGFSPSAPAGYSQNTYDGLLIPPVFYDSPHPSRVYNPQFPGGFDLSESPDHRPAVGLRGSQENPVRENPSPLVLQLFNGDFQSDYELSTNTVPGWSFHGGGGPAAIGSSLMLGANTFYDQEGDAYHIPKLFRTHNPFYIAPEWNYLTFDWAQTRAGVSSEQLKATLTVDGKIFVVDSIAMQSTTSAMINRRVRIPDEIRGKVGTLTFELVDGDSNSTTYPRSQIELDNIQFKTLGLTGDVVELDLLAQDNTLSKLQVESIQVKTGSSWTSVRSRVTQRGDWELTTSPSNSNVPAPFFGTLLFSDREAANTPFSQTGRLYFVPATGTGVLGDTNLTATGFQGEVRINYSVVSQGDVRRETRKSVIFSVVDGLSRSGEDAATGNTGFKANIVLQQRLNYLRARDFSTPSTNGAFADGGSQIPSLVVDGIVGPLTRDMLQRFKAATNTPSADNAELDSLVLAYLNDSRSSLSVEERARISRGLRAASEKLGVGHWRN